MGDEQGPYKVRCRTKDCPVYEFWSNVKPVVGKPCPNPECPLGNPIITEVWWERRWIKAVGIASGFVVLGILLLDVGGWGTFVLDLALSFLVQAVIALILFGMLLAIFLIAFGKALT
jgi:hypothetical protein